MSIKKHLHKIQNKLAFLSLNLTHKGTKDIQPTPQQEETPKEAPIKVVFSKSYTNRIKELFEQHLNKNHETFIRNASTYFAHLIVFGKVQSKHGDALQSKSLGQYETIEDMFPLVTLIDTPKDSPNAQDFYTSDILTLEGVLRWFSDVYVKTQFEGMLLGVNPKTGLSLIDNVLTEQELQRPNSRRQALEQLTNSIDEVFFIYLRATLLNSLRDRVPKDVYRAGEFDAKVMNSSHDKHMEDVDKENIELLASISRTNQLWLRVITDYESMYREKFPKGRVTEELYDSKLIKVLQNLKNKGVKAEDIQELSLIDNKLDLEVMRKIKVFDFIRG